MQTIARYFIAFLLLLISHVIQTDPEDDKEIVRKTIRPGSTYDQSYSILPISTLESCIADLEEINWKLETVRGIQGDSFCGSYML